MRIHIFVNTGRLHQEIMTVQKNWLWNYSRNIFVECNQCKIQQEHKIDKVLDVLRKQSDIKWLRKTFVILKNTSTITLESEGRISCNEHWCPKVKHNQLNWGMADMSLSVCNSISCITNDIQHTTNRAAVNVIWI